MSPSWASSNRRRELPANWKQLRLQVGARDSWSCQWRLPDGSLCLAHATDCDHIQPSGPDEMFNLQMLCATHHAAKSSREGGQASAAALKALKKKIERPAEQNPAAPKPATKPRHPGF